MKKYDITIIGSGPGGYVAGLFAAKKGLKVCMVEENEIGGVCLNKGCIPTKSFIGCSRLYGKIRDHDKYGIDINGATIDIKKVSKRAMGIVNKLKNGIGVLLKARKIELLRGRGRILSKNEVQVDGRDVVSSNNIIIATGSSPVKIPAIKIDGDNILNSQDVFNIKDMPGEVIIVGGGAIGCEFASMFNDFGSKVHIVEMAGRIIPNADEEVSKKLYQSFSKKGIGIRTDTSIDELGTVRDKKVRVKTDKGDEILADKLIVSAGRAPNTKDLGLENVGIEFDNRGIKVDGHMRTGIPNIYAIGDCIGGYMFAHVASHEGIKACESILGDTDIMDYRAVPYCIFTDPEIAFSGMNEDEAKRKGMAYAVSKFYFRALGRAHTSGETDGYVKLIYEKETEDVIGASIMGQSAGEILSEISLAIHNRCKVSDIARTIHAHPTIAESIFEAANLALGTPIHCI